MKSDLFSLLSGSCRRGMKELDLMLIPFAEHTLINLSESQQHLFQSLLKLDDLTLFGCFFNHKRLADEALQTLSEVIRHYH